MLLFGKWTTANLYSHLEYNAKVASAETIARVLGGDKNEKPADEEKKSEGSEPDAPKKRGRKKKNETAQDTSQLTAV